MTLMATETGYRIKGTTDDVTDCQRDGCGQTGLKKTVILAVLDEDGNEADRVYYGTDCAAQATGRRRTAIVNDAALADRETAERREWAHNILDVYGPVEHSPIREKAELYFSRNPGMRFKGVKASVEVAQMLADARAALNS